MSPCLKSGRSCRTSVGDRLAPPAQEAAVTPPLGATKQKSIFIENPPEPIERLSSLLPHPAAQHNGRMTASERHDDQTPPRQPHWRSAHPRREHRAPAPCGRHALIPPGSPNPTGIRAARRRKRALAVNGWICPLSDLAQLFTYSHAANLPHLPAESGPSRRQHNHFGVLFIARLRNRSVPACWPGRYRRNTADPHAD